MAESKSLRYRVNVDSSTKGVLTFSSTVEGEGYTRDEVLFTSDLLVAELVKRYPLAVEVPKEKK